MPTSRTTFVFFEDDVAGDDAAAEFKDAQQFGNSGDFVGFFVDFVLAEKEPVFSSPSVDDVVEVLIFVTCATLGFAVDGDDLAIDGCAHVLGPMDQAFLEGFGGEELEDAVESIVTGDAVVAVQDSCATNLLWRGRIAPCLRMFHHRK